MRKLLVCFGLSALLLVLLTGTAIASDYPAKPVKIVVPYSPGGLSDTTARLVAKFIEKRHLLDVPIVIVNIKGGGGVIGAREVLKAKPDGYTLLWHHHSMLTAFTFGNSAFTWSDFVPIASLVNTGATMVVRADSPWKTLEDLINYAKKNPGKVRYGINPGTMSHLGGISHALAMGVKFTFVPGGGDSIRIPQLLRGEIDVTSSGGLTIQYIKSGELRPLAYVGTKRHPILPDVPTLLEKGINSYEEFTLGLFAPKGTPKYVVKTWNEVFEKLSKDADFMAEVEKKVCFVRYMPHDEFVQYLKKEQERCLEIALKAGIISEKEFNERLQKNVYIEEN